MIKKLCLSVSILVLFCALPLFSQIDDRPPPPEFTSLVFKEIPGSYAIYRDTRFGETAYIGLCAIGGNELALRLYIPSDKTELLFMQTFYTVPNTVDPTIADIEGGTIDLIRGDFSANTSTKRFLPLLYDWMNAWLHSRSRFDEMPEYSFEEKSTYNFQYWIPVLQMKGCEAGTEGLGAVTLVTAGVAESGFDPAFFEFTGEGKIVAGPEVVLAAGEPRQVNVSGLSVPLDSNWSAGDGGMFFISRSTPQDATFTVDIIDVSDFGNSDTFDMIKLFILYSGSILLPEGLSIFSFDENPCLFYRVYDTETGQATIQYKLFLPRDPNSIFVVSLGALESVYKANRDFFDSILF
jgi:hypothetical protein